MSKLMRCRMTQVIVSVLLAVLICSHLLTLYAAPTIVSQPSIDSETETIASSTTTSPLTADDLPSYLTLNVALSKGHTQRMYEKEPNDTITIFKNENGSFTAYYAPNKFLFSTTKLTYESPPVQSLINALNLNTLQIGSIATDKSIVSIEYSTIGGNYYLNNRDNCRFVYYNSLGIRVKQGVYTSLGNSAEFIVEYVSDGYHRIRPINNDTHALYLTKTAIGVFTLSINTQPSEVVSTTGTSVSSLWRFIESADGYEIINKLSPSCSSTSSETYKIFSPAPNTDVKCSPTYSQYSSNSSVWRLLAIEDYQAHSVTSFTLSINSIQCLVNASRPCAIQCNSSATYLKSANEFFVQYSQGHEYLVRETISNGAILFTGLEAGVSDPSCTAPVTVIHRPTGLSVVIPTINIRPGTGTFVLRNRAQNKCLRPTTGGTQLTQSIYSSGTEFLFTVSKSGNYYQFKNTSGNYLTYTSGSSIAGFAAKNNTDSQLWGIQETGESSFYIYPKITGATTVIQLMPNGIVALRPYLEGTAYFDEWIFFNPDITSFNFLGDLPGDITMKTASGNIGRTMNAAFENYNMYRYYDKSFALFTMQNSRVAAFITHGLYDSILTSTVDELMSDDTTTEYQWLNGQDLGASWTVGSLASSDLIVLTACYSGARDPNSPNQLCFAELLEYYGANTVIGFSIKIKETESRIWTEYFFYYLLQGNSISQAHTLAYAKAYKATGTTSTNSIVIYGDSTAVIYQ